MTPHKEGNPRPAKKQHGTVTINTEVGKVRGGEPRCARSHKKARTLCSRSQNVWRAQSSPGGERDQNGVCASVETALALSNVQGVKARAYMLVASVLALRLSRRLVSSELSDRITISGSVGASQLPRA